MMKAGHDKLAFALLAALLLAPLAALHAAELRARIGQSRQETRANMPEHP
jgi:hypothetical protein